MSSFRSRQASHTRRPLLARPLLSRPLLSRPLLARLGARRVLAALAGLSLVAGTAVAVAPAASADPGAPVSRSATGVTADALPTVQIDGVVWTQTVSGDTVYAGGSFSTARPAGSAAGVNTVTRNNLLAYNITTGNLITSFAPSLNAQVRALTLSPDGSRLYVGGDFTTADGQPRYRIAAYDTASGALISSFAPTVDTTVNAIVATNSTVYVGGAFSQANGVARARLAAFSASDGSLLGWAPTADNNEVEAMVMAPAGDKIVVGGSFTTLNGSSSGYGLGALDPSTGALLPWAASSTIKNAGTAAAILSLSTDGTAIYGSGYVFGAGGNLEGAFSANPSTGALNWVEDCHGDTYDTFPVNGTVFTVGHAHDCTNTGDFPQTNPWSYHFSLSWTANATGTNLHNQVGGYADFGGTPSPSLVNWFPDYTEGTYTGQSQATWSVSGNSKYLVVGGEFPTVNGVAQQGLVRYAVPSLAPDKQGPMVSGSLYQTTETAISGTAVRVTWPANWDRDDQNLTYQLIRNGDDNHPIYTTTAVSQFWNRPTLSYVDTDVSPNTTYNYYVRVTDPDGNSVRGDYTVVTTPAGSASGYAQRVLTDGAADYWRFGEASGATVAADSAGSSPLTEQAGVTEGAAGAIAGDTNTAATFSGTSTGAAATTTAVTSPSTFTIETWLKTSTTKGGKIVGFGSSTTGSSASYDRHLYLDNSGHVIFGVYNGATQTITSTKTYNDNTYHQIVGTLSGTTMSLYVDGALIATKSTGTAPSTYTGYWRVGGDNLAGWPSTPTSTNIAGVIDDTSIYPTALNLSTVQAHYTASGRTLTATAAPTPAFTASCTALTCSVDASSSTAASGLSIAGYAWSFGDGTTATGVTATHAYAAAGSYSVTLTVTDSAGGTASVTKVVSPVAPTPPTATFTSSCTNLSCTFDGSGSSAAGGATITGYAWTFGDGSTGTGAKPSHTYTAGGTDTVTLTVTDSAGRTAAVSRSVSPSAPARPTASFTSSCTNLSCSFDASASGAVGGATITSYAWTFGDNSSGTGVKPSHTYAAGGTDTVTLTVLDSNNQSATASGTVTPAAAASGPAATFTSSCTNLSCALDASGTKAATGATISSYAWTFGDNSSGTGVNPTHTYAKAGTYTVTLTATDSAGRVGSVSKSVTASAAAAPVAADTFSRSVSNGWGTADTGGSWGVYPASAYSVSGGVGQIALGAPGASTWTGLNASATNANVMFDIGLSKAVTGSGLIVALGARSTSSGVYYFKVRFLSGGVVHLVVSKSTAAEGETVIREVAVSGLTYTPGTLLRARFQLSGTGTTTMSGKIWPVGSTEPAASQVSVTDNEPSLQSAGSFTLLTFLAGDATNTPLNVLFDNFSVTGA